MLPFFNQTPSGNAKRVRSNSFSPGVDKNDLREDLHKIFTLSNIITLKNSSQIKVWKRQVLT